MYVGKKYTRSSQISLTIFLGQIPFNFRFIEPQFNLQGNNDLE